VIGTFHAVTQSSHANHTNPKPNDFNAQSTPTTTPSTNNTVEVNFVQSTPSRRNPNKKKGKGKNKEEINNNPQSDKAKTQTADEKDKRKPHYPCLICGDDHYTKDCPKRAEVTKFLQGTRNPSKTVILSQPFPSQQQDQLFIHVQATPSTLFYFLMCTGDFRKNKVAVAIQAKDYSPLKEKVDDIPPSLVQPSPPTSPPNGPLHIERLGLNTFLRPPPKGIV
jgi:hypothetical protein